MFRALPPFGSDPRGVAEIVNGLMNGKSNNTGTVTLSTGGATSTTIFDDRISSESKIILIPFSAAAFADKIPFGAFKDGTDQTAASTTAAYPITFDTTDFGNGITLTNTSRINFKNAGVYAVNLSVQLANDDSQIQDVDIFFRKNGTDIANSNRRFSVDSKHGSIKGHMVAHISIFVEVSANDYVEAIWHTSNLNVILEHIAAQTTPTRPITPSVILTAQYVNPSSTYAGIYVSSQSQGSAVVTHFANSTANLTLGFVVVG